MGTTSGQERNDKAATGGVFMSPEIVTSSDVFLWALYELGGADEFIDVEDVFIKAFELAPLRLSWRTRPNIPDLKKCSKALRDAEGRHPLLLVKNGPEKRRLTVEGQLWIERNFDRLAEALQSEAPVRATHQRTPARLINRAAQSWAYKTWVDSGVVTSEKWRAAELLRCSPDSARTTFRDRLEELRSAAFAAGRLDALEFLDELSAQRSDWF